MGRGKNVTPEKFAEVKEVLSIPAIQDFPQEKIAEHLKISVSTLERINAHKDWASYEKMKKRVEANYRAKYYKYSPKRKSSISDVLSSLIPSRKKSSVEEVTMDLQKANKEIMITKLLQVVEEQRASIAKVEELITLLKY